MPETSAEPRLGFIGVGAMGAPMAANLLKRFSHLTVHDVVAERVQPLVEQGARAALSCAEVARQSDIVLTMVPKTEHLEQVVFGASGLAGAMTTLQIWPQPVSPTWRISMPMTSSRGRHRSTTAASPPTRKQRLA